MNLNQKEIVLLPYPFSDLANTKVRPAIVLSNNNFNQKFADCIMAPLTSVIKEESLSVLISQENLSKGKLLKTSRIKLNKLFAVDKNKVAMRIGILDDKTFNKIKSEIIRIF